MSESEQDLDDERQDPGELAEAEAGGFCDQTESHQNEADPVIPSFSPEAVAESEQRDETRVTALSEEIRQMDNPALEVIKAIESQTDRKLSPKVVQMFESSPVVSREIDKRQGSDEIIAQNMFQHMFRRQKPGEGPTTWGQRLRRFFHLPLSAADQKIHDLAEEEAEARRAVIMRREEQIKEAVVQEYLQFLADPTTHNWPVAGASGEVSEDDVLKNRVDDDPEVQKLNNELRQLRTESFLSSKLVDSFALLNRAHIGNIDDNYRAEIKRRIIDTEVKLRTKRLEVQARTAQELLAGGDVPDTALSRAEEPHSDAERGLSRTDEDE